MGNAFDPFVLDDHEDYLYKQNEKVYDIIFSGESGYNKFDHIERYHFLKFLMTTHYLQKNISDQKIFLYL